MPWSAERCSASIPTRTSTSSLVAAVMPLPDQLPPGRAVLAANMETAIGAVWDARPLVGDRVVVIGAGVVGLLIGWLCRQTAGADVAVVDINPSRESVARELDLPFLTAPPGEADADLVFSRERPACGATDRPGRGRRGGHDRGCELVWNPVGHSAAGRGVPRQAVDDQEQPGRAAESAADTPVDTRSTHGARAGPAAGPEARRVDHGRERV